MFDLSFSWWNTGIDPIRKRKNPKNININDIHSIVKTICEESDVVILGEYIDRHNLYDTLPARFTIRNCYSFDNGVKFHTVVIFNSSRFRIEGEVRTISRLDTPDKEGYRVAQIVSMRELKNLELFDFYIIHWRMNRNDDEDNKCIAAKMVYDDYCDNDKTKYKFIIGDFNTEPFTRPLKYLFASRCREYATKEGAFWNPFWDNLRGGGFGTIRGNGERKHMCYNPVFDQILVSQTVAAEKCEISHSIWRAFNPENGEHWPVLLKIRSEQYGQDIG